MTFNFFSASQLVKRLFFISLMLSVLLFSACGGGGGSSEGDLTDGITVTFNASPRQSLSATGERLSAPAGAKTFYNHEGVKITLKTAYLVIWSVSIKTDCNSIDFATWWNPLLNLLIPNAQAHAQTTPTQLGTPNAINLLDADGQNIILGEIYPAPASYCGMQIDLMKADEDTQHLPQTLNLLNRVLYIEGEYLPVGATEAIPFKLDIAKTPRPQSLRFSTPLVLSNTQRTATLDFYVHYDRWFDGVDFSALNTDTQIDWVLNNVTESLGL
ncbi:hypothetical protein BegalDRAFT_0553 [Beggiatoa alba B18LD]|uniref:Uncharacterized protein n=1 Tax=Beggiatoa alba B18LD TaxID=395493 RepID=I3CCX8_9GAMM|nr:hypothetical protein [Beggiatoa alba]EIJ41471.1 hypothetical protein BegalDRAFT_0553 [Beggiatoa alba B18LD]